MMGAENAGPDIDGPSRGRVDIDERVGVTNQTN